MYAYMHIMHALFCGNGFGDGDVQLSTDGGESQLSNARPQHC